MYIYIFTVNIDYLRMIQTTYYWSFGSMSLTVNHSVCLLLSRLVPINSHRLRLVAPACFDGATQAHLGCWGTSASEAAILRQFHVPSIWTALLVRKSMSSLQPKRKKPTWTHKRHLLTYKNTTRMFVFHQFSKSTPPKTNMEPEKDGLQKESLAGVHFQVPCGFFGGV